MSRDERAVTEFYPPLVVRVHSPLSKQSMLLQSNSPRGKLNGTVFAQVFAFPHYFPPTFVTNFKAGHTFIQISVMNKKWSFPSVGSALNFKLFTARLLKCRILYELQTVLKLNWYNILMFDQFHFFKNNLHNLSRGTRLGSLLSH